MSQDLFPAWFVKLNPDSVDWAKLILNPERPSPPSVEEPPPFIPTPIAVADSYAVDSDQVLIVAAPGVLQNDNDTWGNGLTAELVDGPSVGSLVFNTNGSFSFDPGSISINIAADSASVLADSSEITADATIGAETVIVTFTYRANNSVHYSNTVTVTITVTIIVPADLVTLKDALGVTLRDANGIALLARAA